MRIKSIVIAFTLSTALQAQAQQADLNIENIQPIQENNGQLVGEWTYNSCGQTAKSDRYHLLKDGETFIISASRTSEQHVQISHERWTMLEEPVLKMVNGSIVAADGVAVIDGHQHQVTLIPANASNCPGTPKLERVIRVDFSDIDHSHDDSSRHAGHVHASGG